MLEQEVNGETHVLVPKKDWERIWAVFDRIEQLGDKYGDV